MSVSMLIKRGRSNTTLFNGDCTAVGIASQHFSFAVLAAGREGASRVRDDKWCIFSPCQISNGIGRRPPVTHRQSRRNPRPRHCRLRAELGRQGRRKFRDDNIATRLWKFAALQVFAASVLGSGNNQLRRSNTIFSLTRGKLSTQRNVRGDHRSMGRFARPVVHHRDRVDSPRHPRLADG